DAASPLRSLARLLYVQLNERASEQKRANQMREQLEAVKNERASEQKRADQMRDQLEALKEVERTIIERGQESQPRRR
ncbi:MAG: hypothetical protein Q8O70_02025, partial [Burkholderiales bacterium]|nr:hypothetical protein [Burkholderiales bacterium]